MCLPISEALLDCKQLPHLFLIHLRVLVSFFKDADSKFVHTWGKHDKYSRKPLKPSPFLQSDPADPRLTWRLLRILFLKESGQHASNYVHQEAS